MRSSRNGYSSTSSRNRIASRAGYDVSVPKLAASSDAVPRSEEHTSELQSPCNLVCRLLLEKKKYRERTISPQLHVSWQVQICRSTLSAPGCPPAWRPNSPLDTVHTYLLLHQYPSSCTICAT